MTVRHAATSIFDIRGNRRAEQEFALRVECAFAPSDATIARVRASILAQLPGPNVITEPSRTTRSARAFTLRLAPLALVLVVALASGFAILRALPADSSLTPASGVSATSSVPSTASAPADLDRADASLQLVLATIRASDATGLKAILVAYQTRLAVLAIDLRQPGTDVAAARDRLQSQASSLSEIASAVAPVDAILFNQVRADLAGLIAALPVKATSTPGHPSAGHSPAAPTAAPTPKPGSSNAPGNGNANDGKGNSNAGGNGNGNAGGNGKGNGNAGGNGNGNAGGNGKGNGNAGGNAGGNGKGNGKGH
jgi:hypothetical protein